MRVVGLIESSMPVLMVSCGCGGLAHREDGVLDEIEEDLFEFDLLAHHLDGLLGVEPEVETDIRQGELRFEKFQDIEEDRS